MFPFLFAALSALGFSKAPTPEINTELLNPSQITCLAENIYHEARGEPLQGQEGVAYVTLNRTRNGHYPKKVCDVVHQGPSYANGMMVHNKCQFSWNCDGKKHTIKEQDAWARSFAVAVATSLTYDVGTDPTHGSLFYNTSDFKNSKNQHYRLMTKIGKHSFFTLVPAGAHAQNPSRQDS